MGTIIAERLDSIHLNFMLSSSIFGQLTLTARRKRHDRSAVKKLVTSLAAARAPFWSPLLLAGAMMAGSRVEPPTVVCSHLQRVRLLSNRGNFEFDSVHNGQVTG